MYVACGCLIFIFIKFLMLNILKLMIKFKYDTLCEGESICVFFESTLKKRIKRDLALSLQRLRSLVCFNLNVIDGPKFCLTSSQIAFKF